MGPHVFFLFKLQHLYQAKYPDLFRSIQKYHKSNHKHFDQLVVSPNGLMRRSLVHMR